jgi:ferric-dicitrate binding protein FerR (iron transport regulator)
LHNLVPGEVVSYDPQTNKYTVAHGNMDQITSWCGDELVIDNKPFTEVMKYLERWYGIETEFTDGFYVDQKLSFKIKTESLGEVMSVIARICPIRYEIEGKTLSVSNIK